MNNLNPMLNLLNQSGRSLPLNLNKIKQYYNMIQNSNNPQGLLQSIIQNNPNMQGIMNYVNQNGGDAKAAFYKLAEQRGVNPDQILNMLKSL